MRRTNLVFTIAVLLGALCFASCSDPKTDIMGKWKEVDGTDRIEFSKDGTVSGFTLGTPFGCKYKFTDDGALWMDTTGMYNGVVKGKVSGSELTLTDSNGMPFKYRKEN
jgi:hypothetical protein